MRNEFLPDAFRTIRNNDTVGASVVVVVVEEDGCTMVHFIPLTGIGVPEVIVDNEHTFHDPSRTICTRQTRRQTARLRGKYCSVAVDE
uniref:Uncharacterized protein n=1 Tax=Pristionchus pacificus TaxID=54126 RepID=A0A2A6C057_PRIPA|eukprot:PDM71564.1 hypothetical protein PRIPAC_37971 [Pristionchus pacificus]